MAMSWGRCNPASRPCRAGSPGRLMHRPRGSHRVHVVSAAAQHAQHAGRLLSICRLLQDVLPMLHHSIGTNDQHWRACQLLLL